MCRWLAYTGNPVYLEELLLEPEHSLIDQSLQARHSVHTTNGDGFGVGWYGDREIPGVYRDIRPAWNDPNLRDLAAQIRSGMFIAHVRAATGTAVQQSNCHPFRHGRWLFVHNGLVSGFSVVKRELVMAIDPQLYGSIRGTTDSEVMFFLALTYGLETDPLDAVARMVGHVERVGRAHGLESPIQMTLGISDGTRLIGIRYSSAGKSRTLYISRDVAALREIHPKRVEHFSEGARAIVSEPLSSITDAWEAIPESTAIVVTGGSVTSHPFRPASTEPAAESA